MSDIMSYLFKTNAIKFCEENKPFWFTSGKLGPYFINTHFVYGSEKEATEFLKLIDIYLNDKISLPSKILKQTLQQYNNNTIYKDVVNTMKNYIEQNINISEIDYISGGERRDWFFSNIIAYLLNKPHISIFKDLSAVVSDNTFEHSELITSLKDKKVLHIADLVTVASSYVRAWIPTIRNLGSQIVWSCVVIDRLEGGSENLKSEGVQPFSLVQVDASLFDKALNMKIINNEQFEMLNKFFANPDETMRNFLIEHPDFLESSLHSDEKTKIRAQLLIDGNLYGLKNDK